MTSPEDLLTRTLHDRVDHRTVPVTAMSDVVSTAGRIRRRRRVRNAAVATVVVGVLATPFAIDTARHGQDDGTGPIDPGPTSAPHVRLADVALGDPPAVPWLDGSEYVAADGTRTTLPLAGVTNATPYRGGFLVAITGPDLVPRVVLLDGDLRQAWTHCGQGAFAVSPDGSRTAYATASCSGSPSTLSVGPTGSDGAEHQRQVPLEQAIPLGFLGESVVTGSVAGARSLVVDLDHGATPIESLGQAVSVDSRRHLVAGRLTGHPDTAAVVDADDDQVLWSRGGWALGAFSPDGSMVLGTQTGRGRGFGLLDARTGDLLHSFGQLAGFQSQQTVWEDDEHLLSVATQGSSQAIIRLTLDGAIERATATAPYDKPSSELSFGFPPSP